MDRQLQMFFFFYLPMR